MKITPTSTYHALYRDIFDLTADDIGRIAIGTPAGVRLHANLSAGGRILSKPQQGVPTTALAECTALRILD